MCSHAEVPLWRGENLRGKVIVLLTEHGLGDSIQFIRFASELSKRGARVVVQCEEPLEHLFHSATGVAEACSWEKGAAI